MPVVDPLYRPRTELPDDAEHVSFAGVAAAVVVTDTDPSTAAAQWSDDREVTLVLTDDVAPEAVSAAVPEFLAHAATRADGRSAGVAVASRDVDRARMVREAGLAPSAVLAVADLQRPGPGDGDAGVEIRDASSDDVDALTRLWWEQAEYEARVGTLRVSDAIRAAIAADVPGIVGGDSTVLLAETDGVAVGAVVAGSTAASGWAATRCTLGPLSYLAMASTADGRRGGGVGRALVAELHRRHRASGVAASALHWSAYNPLSVPFWSRQGYRPLVTHYSRRLG